MEFDVLKQNFVQDVEIWKDSLWQEVLSRVAVQILVEMFWDQAQIRNLYTML